MVKGLKNAYFMHFSSLHSWFRCHVCYYLQCSSSFSQRVKPKGQKTLFWVKNLFQLMCNHKPKANAPLRKNHKTADRKGGGLKNAYLMHFSSLPSWFHCCVCYYLQCSSSLSQGVKQRVKKLFFGQNSFQPMYNHKQKSNAPLRKKHK